MLSAIKIALEEENTKFQQKLDENKDFFFLQVHKDFEIYEIVQCDLNCSDYTEPKENEG